MSHTPDPLANALHSFTLYGRKFQIKRMVDPDFKSRPWVFKRTTARAYVDILKEPSDLPLQVAAVRLGAESIYTIKGEFPEMDRLWQTYNAFLQAEHLAILTTALIKFNYVATTNLPNIVFSRVAGCSCGCSPGYVIYMPKEGDHRLNRFDNFYVEELAA